MNRLSGLVWLATFVLLIGLSGSSSQAFQVAANGWEWGQSATLSSPLGQYALDRPVTEPAVVRGVGPQYTIASKANRPALSVEMQPGLSLTRPHDLIIELPRDGLTRLLTDGLPGQLQRETGPVIVLIVLVSNVCEKRPAGSILQCSPLMTDVWTHDKDPALARFPGEPRSWVKRGPTKSGNSPGRRDQLLTCHYDWLLPELK